ncbi:T9SS type A sorting domain-containing protein, partial [bacterium]|nr:T9SS type A sorting domain-containing protein [bacterium]
YKVVTGLSNNTTYYWHASAANSSGSSSWSATWQFTTKNGTGVDNQQNNSVTKFRLMQNYPNPFNPLTNIQYSLPISGQVSIEVFNVSGDKIITLSEGYEERGNHLLTWESRDSYGKPVPAGLYFCVIKIGTYCDVIRMLLLK